MTGLQLLTHLHALDRDLPVILLTATAMCLWL